MLVLAVHPSKEYLYTTNEVSDFNNINNSGLLYNIHPLIPSSSHPLILSSSHPLLNSF